MFYRSGLSKYDFKRAEILKSRKHWSKNGRPGDRPEPGPGPGQARAWAWAWAWAWARPGPGPGPGPGQGQARAGARPKNTGHKNQKIQNFQMFFSVPGVKKIYYSNFFRFFSGCFFMTFPDFFRIFSGWFLRLFPEIFYEKMGWNTESRVRRRKPGKPGSRPALHVVTDFPFYGFFKRPTPRARAGIQE